MGPFATVVSPAARGQEEMPSPHAATAQAKQEGGDEDRQRGGHRVASVR